MFSKFGRVRPSCEIFSQLEKCTSDTRAQTAIHCTRYPLQTHPLEGKWPLAEVAELLFGIRRTHTPGALQPKPLPRALILPGGQIPRMARSPSSMSSTKTLGKRPASWPSTDRSINSTPKGTATESFGSPLARAGRKTLPAIPARSTLEVMGTTWVCQTFTLSTSLDDTTTHGLRLSRSIQ
jgi:hypothetical protein